MRYNRVMDAAIIVTRLLIVFTFSLLFGFQRQRSHKPTGFGTFIYVSIGSCGLTLSALIVNSGNSMPLIAAIVTGIGFLGAGALIRTQDKVFGFTTAASIWLFASFGIIIGFGQYLIGLTIYVMIWIVVAIDTVFEMRGIGSHQIKLAVSAYQIMSTDMVEKKLPKNKLLSLSMNKKENKVKLLYLVEVAQSDAQKLIETIMKEEFIEYVEIID